MAVTWRKLAFADQVLANVVEDTTPQLGGDLELNGHNILYTSPGSDVSAQGHIISATVDTNAEGVGAPLMMAADGHFDTADADAETTAPCLALALETGTGTKKILLFGIIRNDSWSWTTGPGKLSLIYLSTTVGTLTQTQPTGTDDVVQIVGWALSAHVMVFLPQFGYFTHI
jgi:hypothetical protein